MITSLLEFCLLLNVYLSDHGLAFPHHDHHVDLLVVVIVVVGHEEEEEGGNDRLKLIVCLSNLSPTFAKVIILIQPI